jgi:hypothetical protein
MYDERDRTEREVKLAQADSRIEEAERNIRHVEALLPQLTRQGYSTVEVEGHLGLMSEALYHLKEQRRLIEGTLH